MANIVEILVVSHETELSSVSAIDDEAILSFISKVDSKERAKVLLGAMRVGVDVLGRLQVSKDVEFVKNETALLLSKVSSHVDSLMANMTTAFESRMREMLSPDDEKSYTGKTVVHLRRQLMDVKTQMNEAVAVLLSNATKISTDKVEAVQKLFKDADEKFNPALETSYFGQVKNVVSNFEKGIGKQLDFMQKDSFASKLLEEATKAFGKDSDAVRAIIESVTEQKNLLQTSIDGLRDSIAHKEGEQDMLEQTAALKGQLFEDELDELLQSYAKTRGDSVESTGRETSKVDSSKKGDFLYTLSDGQSFVIEAKDSAVGLKPMQKYLDEAMKNRNVEFSILVVKHPEQLQKQIDQFELYDGNKLFCSSDNLTFAIRWARLYLLKVKGDTVKKGSVNKTKILETLESIRSEMRIFKTIKQSLTALETNVSSGVSTVHEHLDTFKSTAETLLSEVEEQFT